MPKAPEKPSAVSIVDDLRDVIEEQISPDLKEIITTLDTIDKNLDRLDTSFDRLDAILDANFDAQAERATARHNELLAKLGAYNTPDTRSHDTLKESVDDVDARLRALEPVSKVRDA